MTQGGLLMSGGPLAVNAGGVVATAAVHLLCFLGKYGCRFRCGDEDVGFGGLVWSRSVGTS